MGCSARMNAKQPVARNVASNDDKGLRHALREPLGRETEQPVHAGCSHAGTCADEGASSFRHAGYAS